MRSIELVPVVLADLPDIDDVRPVACPRCAHPALAGGRLHIYGHGPRWRSVVIPGPALGRCRLVDCWVRRFRCQVCQKTCSVLPDGVILGFTYSIASMSPVHFSCHYLAFVTLSPRDFIRQLCLALDLEAKATIAALFNALQAEIAHRHREHRVHPVIVIDEAHLIPDRTLSQLHVLANFDWDSKPLVSFVLVGLPELHSRMKLGVHRSLLTRLSTKVELTPATPEHTSAYVRQRINGAGVTAELFAPDALGMLHELTGGVLRSIDVLATEALRIAAVQDVKIVDRALLVRAHRASPLS